MFKDIFEKQLLCKYSLSIRPIGKRLKKLIVKFIINLTTEKAQEIINKYEYEYKIYEIPANAPVA